MLPEGLVEEIKRRTSLVALIGEYVTLKKAGRAHVGLCPFHGEKTPSLHVHEAQGFYHCFGCGQSGDAISFLRDQVGYSFMEAVTVLAERAGVELPAADAGGGPSTGERKRSREMRDRYFALNARAARWFQAQVGAEATAYLVKRRGLTPETLRAFGIGFAPDEWDGLTTALGGDPERFKDAEALGLVAPRRTGDGFYDRFRHRVIFPVYALGGEIVGFGGRTLSTEPDAPKYINSVESPIFKKGQALYGLYQARRAVRTAERALVVEGIVDVLTLAQHGLEETVAPMGTALTEDQCRLLRRFTERVVLIYDGDDAGRAAAQKAIPLALSVGLDGHVVSLPVGEDPDSFVRSHGAAGLEALIASAPPLFDYALGVATEGFDGSVPAASRVVKLVEPVYQLITDPVQRDLYRRRLAQRLRVSEAEVARWLGLRPDLRAPRPGGRPEARRPDARGAAKLEIALAGFLMRHPEYLPFWQARLADDSEGGAGWVEHPGIARLLEAACADAAAHGAVDIARLVREMTEAGESELAGWASRLVMEEEPLGYEGSLDRVFVDLAEQAEALATKRRRRSRMARLQGPDLDRLPVAEQVARLGLRTK